MDTPSTAPDASPGQPPADLPRRSRPAPRGTASYQRKRAVKACQVCRARRTKCDNLKPSCSFCLKVGAKCIQSAEDLSSFDPASLKILERLECLEQLVRSSRCISTTGAPSPTLQAPQQDEDNELHSQGPPAKKQRRSEQDDENNECNTHLDINMVLFPNSEDMLSSWPILQSLATSCYHGSPALSLPQHPQQEGLQQQQSYHTPQSHHSQPHNQGRNSIGVTSPVPVPIPSLAQILPDDPRHIATLLDKFFNHVHVKNPILNESLTRQMVLSKAMDGQLGFDWSAESCLALLICALGSLSTRFGPSTDSMPGTRSYSEAHAYFSAAQKRLGLLLACDDDDDNGIVAPQCFFLAGVFMMCTFQSGKGWKYFVQAVVGCQEFGFLTAGERGGGGAAGRRTKDDTPHHQAIYWSAWKSERELRGDVRRPDFLAGGADHHDTRLYPSFFPTPPAPRVRSGVYVGELGVRIMGTSGDADADGEEDGMMSLDQSREQMSWYFYLAEISLRRLTVRVTAEMVTMMETANETCSTTSVARQMFLDAMADALPSFEAQVGNWQTSLPPRLSFDNNNLPSDQQQQDEDDVCRFVLRGHLINFYEIIYWPFLSIFLIYGNGSDVDGQLSSLRSRFAEQAQRGLEHHMSRLIVNKSGYRHRHHGTDPLLRSCSRSSLVLLTASRLQHAGQTCQGPTLVVPDGWQAEFVEFLETLDFWSAETNRYDEIRKVMQQGVFS